MGNFFHQCLLSPNFDASIHPQNWCVLGSLVFKNCLQTHSYDTFMPLQGSASLYANRQVPNMVRPIKMENKSFYATVYHLHPFSID